MVDRNIDKFTNIFKGGLRNNVFEITFPGLRDYVGKYLVKSTSFPSYKIGTVDFSLNGRKYKLPGDREFSDWSCTFYGDSTLDVYQQLVEWNQKFSNIKTNQTKYDPSIFQDISIRVFNQKAGETPFGVRQITLFNCFPIEVQELEFKSDTLNSIIDDIKVTFVYTHFDRS